MQVELNIKLDLPENCQNMSQAELEQLVFDTYVNFVTKRHSIDAMQWCAKAKVGTENEDVIARRIFEHHELWADLSAQATWSLKKEVQAT
jgi:hypothetical protein